MWNNKLLSIVAFGFIVKLSTFAYGDEEAKHYAVVVTKLDNTIRQECGAAIIHRHFILTTANCVYGKNIDNLAIMAGGYKPPPPDKPYRETRVFKRIARIHYPSDFVPGAFENDVAVIKIIGNFALVDLEHFDKAYLPLSNFDYNWKWAVLSGYKNYDVYDNDTAMNGNDFESLDVSVISNEKCQRLMQINITSGNLCGKPFSLEDDECFGLPGNPLVYNGQVIGLMSKAHCNNDTPQLFTRVSTFVDYIKSVIRSNALF